MVLDDPHARLLVFAVLTVAVAVLCWLLDHDGMRSSYQYHRLCRRRERLSGEEFYRRFYRGSGLPTELVIGFRDFHAGYWGEAPEVLRPEDDLFRVNAGADLAGWVAEVESLYGVAFRWVGAETYDMPDVTFDSMVRFIHREQQASSRRSGSS
jgi:hypothetical protein